MRSFYHSATNFLPFADRTPTSPEATEGESGKFNLYNPYLAPADMTSAPRVHFGIGRTVESENFDLREEISDLGRRFGEAMAQKEETFPSTSFPYVELQHRKKKTFPSAEELK